MTERGLPIVDGAPACPFVAFADDRDERAVRPDHRHRCYAEVRPASRALAHQEAYCLATAFAACPTFQDWARREAARVRPGARVPPPLEPADLPAYRSSHRDWAAPPPWIDEPGGPGSAATGAPGAAALPERAAGSEGAAIVAGTAAAAGGAAAAAGTAAVASGGAPAGAAPPDAPAFLAPRDKPAAADPSSSAALASSPVRPTSGVVRPTTGTGLTGATAGLAAGDAGDDRWAGEDEVEDDPVSPAPPARGTSGSGRTRRRRGSRPSVSESRRESRSLSGPSWERPQRFEAYPKLKTRVGLPDVPRVAIWFGGLLLAALLLFFIPPLLIRPGGTDTGTGAQATPSPTVGPSTSLEPTPIPAATPVVYVIASGDTLSTVAQKFGITLNDLLAANPSIKNPDIVKAGQQVVIPIAVPSEVVDAGGLDASPGSSNPP